MLKTLNHCVDLIFLRRIGGGYTFVHSMMIEHFLEIHRRVTIMLSALFASVAGVAIAHDPAEREKTWLRTARHSTFK
jgi:hypothetical protein